MPNRTWKANDKVCRKELIDLLASRDRQSDETLRNAKARQRSRIKSATKRRVFSVRADGMYLMGEVGAWLRTEWPDICDDLPANCVVHPSSLNAITLSLGSPDTVFLPSTQAECAHMIFDLSEQLRQIRKECDELLQQVALLTPYKERDAALRLICRANGEKRKRSANNKN